MKLINIFSYAKKDNIAVSEDRKDYFYPYPKGIIINDDKLQSRY